MNEEDAITALEPQPVREVDGSLKQFMLKIAGKPLRCDCGCNVFHKPDRTNLDRYRCNACDWTFEAL